MLFIKILLIILSLGISLPSTFTAEASTESSGSTYGETIYERVDYLDLNVSADSNGLVSDNYIIEPTADPISIAIFFGGIATAWIIDGVITYRTGSAPSEWIALGLHSIESQIRTIAANSGGGGLRQITVSQNGQVSGCIAFPCQIMSVVEPDF